MTDIKIEYVKNLHPIFTKPKRIKIIVGGRGSTKSTGVADYVAALVSNGQLCCCARENQNSIEESPESVDRSDGPSLDEDQPCLCCLLNGRRCGTRSWCCSESSTRSQGSSRYSMGSLEILHRTSPRIQL